MHYYKYLAALVVGLSLTVSAQAATTTGSTTLEIRQNKQEKAEMRGDTYRENASSSRSTLKGATSTEERCMLLTKSIDARVNSFDARHQAHLNAYYRNQAQLENLIVRLDAEGKDTTKLKADLKVLDVKIKAFNDQVLLVKSKLEATKQYACGSSQGQFRESVKQAQDGRKVGIEMARDIRDYVQNTIKPDVLAMRGVPATASSTKAVTQ